MKKSLLLILTMSVVVMACAGRMAHIQWTSSLDDGLDEAKASNRPVVIDFTNPT